MTNKTREQGNVTYHKRPENIAKAKIKNRLRYLRNLGETGECKPNYGISFKSAAVQLTLTKWGG